MKKVISLLLVLVMAIAFTACGGNNNELEKVEETQAKQIPVLNEINITWMGSTKTYAVGSKMEINEAGQIAEIEKTYNDYTVEYNEEGAATKINILSDDPEKNGYESLTYENGLLVSGEYAPNDGFRSSRVTAITIEKDADGKVVSMTENNVYTDAENGSKSSDVTKYEYEYDPNGKIAAVKYSKDGKLDHTTKISYDENGNMVKYENIGASNNSVYLSVTFGYSMVDEGTITPKDLDAFTVVNNFELILNQIL